MSTITRELAKLFRKITNSEIDAEGNAHVVLSPADSLLINNARIALASLETEASGRNPVLAYADSYRDMANQGVESIPVWSVITDLERNIAPLFTAPPPPLSVPAAMEMDDNFDSAFEHGKAVGWNSYRAAMLQGADRPQNEPQNIPENIPATQFKPVADLYGLTSPTGGETSFTFDAVEARDFIDGGWSCQEYVELGRFQEAMLQGAENAESPTTMKTAPALDSSPKIAESPSGNYPVIQDGWVACSERMPEESGRYWCYVEEQNDLGKSHYQWNCSWNGDRWWVESENGGRVTHWMPLPAAPQQEVK
ncbi:Protein of uncharacterised function (DUF551) [Enterobacter hormaechei]|uniref:DUF551 domain-containing protein n=1 Tax=Enterobacter hormaechei TaxID=158836 RepID=UPI00079209BB|nr:DUF551 domain-containing protein [Enterobacter hormaechei]SAG70243.1 Protein of uncharacterised function (DUF551) [Enterobacter hormaechei]